MEKELVLMFERAVCTSEDTLDWLELKALRLRQLRSILTVEIKRLETAQKDMVATGRSS